MLPFQLSNANASVISVGATAQTLKALIDTAAGAQQNYTARRQLDAVDIVAEDGDIRVLYDGNTPTASKGILIREGMTFCIRHVLLDNIKLISVLGSTSCSIQIGESEGSETTALTGGGGGSGSSAGGASAAGAGAGSADYGNLLGDFIATINNGTKTVTLSAFRDATVQAALTTANFLFGYAKVTPAAGGAVETIPFTSVAYVNATGVLTLADKAVNFTTGDLIDLHFFSYPKELTNRIAGEDLSNDVQGMLFKPAPVPDYGGVFTTNAAFTTANAKAAAGNFLKLFVLNTTANPRYFQLHNTATTPGGGATAFFSVLVPANSYVVLGNDAFGPEGIHLNTGIAIANSTVAATYTAGTSGDLIAYYSFI